LKRKRTQHRSVLKEIAEKEFAQRSGSHLVIHWDGKLMNDSTDKTNPNQKIDRLAVITPGKDVSKILGIPKLENGSGEAQAIGVFDLLKKWKLEDDIIGMSFDTTSSNTGPYKGAAVLLERYLGRKLLNLACRHHVYELLVEATFTVFFGKTTSPEVSMFVVCGVQEDVVFS
jgi:hypothetical protein